VSYPPFLSTIIFAAKICHNCELVEKRQNVIAEKFDIFSVTTTAIVKNGKMSSFCCKICHFLHLTTEKVKKEQNVIFKTLKWTIFGKMTHCATKALLITIEIAVVLEVLVTILVLANQFTFLEIIRPAKQMNINLEHF
jgi:hypothetical protein